MTLRYTLPLSDARAELAGGGKGASLARLAGAGLPVPDGIHVTTAAYRQFVSENSLQPCILEALQAVDPDQPATLEAASAQIHTLFAAGRVPTDVAAAIEPAYTDLANSVSPRLLRLLCLFDVSRQSGQNRRALSQCTEGGKSNE